MPNFRTLCYRACLIKLNNIHNIHRVGYTWSVIHADWDTHGVGYTERDTHGVEYIRSGIYTEWNTHGVGHTEWNTHEVEYTRNWIH